MLTRSRSSGRGIPFSILHRSSNSSCKSSLTAVPAAICTGPLGPGTIIACLATQSPFAFLVNDVQGSAPGIGRDGGFCGAAGGGCCAIIGKATAAASNKPEAVRLAFNDIGSPFPQKHRPVVRRTFAAKDPGCNRHPRAADDFAPVRARMDELRRQREQARRAEPEDNLGARVRRVPIEEQPSISSVSP